MNKLLPFLFLLAGLSGCGSKGTDPAPAPTDPLLGHWQSQTLRSVVYEANGQVKSDETRTASSQLDITPTTITIISTVNGRTSTEVNTYTRNGELLTVMPPSGNPGTETVYARNLTPATFTLEFNEARTSGRTYYIQSIPYRR